ncbi:hypothetical protein ACQEVY_23415 [Streptomyces sp. CA-288835]|uniref:hypothetical protein n=1 Tax=Streptomyces sp. CA-288835 TaxID=3240069 RepID=UPI003D8A7918
MADHDNTERYLALAEAVVGAFAYVASLLEDLPLPITVPDLVQAGEGEPTKVLVGLNRARTLIADEPISHGHKRAFERMMLDWFAAYETLALVRLAGPAPWRLDVAEYALERLVTWIEMIENDELNDDES